MGKGISNLACNRPAITDRSVVALIILDNDVFMSQPVTVMGKLKWLSCDLQTNFHCYETATTYSFSF